MTGEEFRSQYHLLNCVSQGDIETHHAQAATGAMVMVHYLRGSDDANARVRSAIERLLPDARVTTRTSSAMTTELTRSTSSP